MFIEKTREKKPEQILRHRRDRSLGGEVFPVKVVDATNTLIGFDEALDEVLVACIGHG